MAMRKYVLPSSFVSQTATPRGREAPKHMPRMRFKGSKKGETPMLWTLFVILLIAWLVGLIGFHIVAWYIHILLLLALVVLVIQLISGRRPVA
jgi:Flp pilus assembly protein TadB